jgi:hypothetical protein
LKRAFGAHRYKYVACSDNLHLAFRKLPQFLAHLDTSRLDRPEPAHA